MLRRAARSNARSVVLTDKERQRLKRLVSRGKEAVRVVNRARVLLLLADGWAPMDVPDAAGVGEATVRRTRQKFERGGVEYALYELPRPGQPRALSEQERAAVVAIACSAPPPGRARWTIALIVEEAKRRKLISDVGRETVRLVLHEHDMKPWREKNVVRT